MFDCRKAPSVICSTLHCKRTSNRAAGGEQGRVDYFSYSSTVVPAGRKDPRYSGKSLYEYKVQESG